MLWVVFTSLAANFLIQYNFAGFYRLVLSLEHFIKSTWVGWSTGKSILVTGTAGKRKRKSDLVWHTITLLSREFSIISFLSLHLLEKLEEVWPTCTVKFLFTTYLSDRNIWTRDTENNLLPRVSKLLLQEGWRNMEITIILVDIVSFCKNFMSCLLQKSKFPGSWGSEQFSITNNSHQLGITANYLVIVTCARLLMQHDTLHYTISVHMVPICYVQTVPWLAGNVLIHLGSTLTEFWCDIHFSSSVRGIWERLTYGSIYAVFVQNVFH